MARATELVHQDAIVHVQRRFLRELDAGDDAESGDDDFTDELAAGGRPHDARARPRLEPRHSLAHPHRHALLAIIVDQNADRSAGNTRAPTPASGTSIVTFRPCIRNAAATSLPMNPPPMTRNRTSCAARAWSRR